MTVSNVVNCGVGHFKTCVPHLKNGVEILNPLKKFCQKKHRPPGPCPVPQIRRKFIDISDKSTVDGNDSAIIVDQFQRASMTSLEDLIDSAKDVRQKSFENKFTESDITALNKVRNCFVMSVCFSGV